MPGSYFQNWLGLLAPQKTEHGYVAAYPVTSIDGRIAVLDIEDFGMFCVTAIERRNDDGTTILAVGDEPTFREAGDAIGQATGKDVTTVVATREQFEQALGPMPPPVKEDLRQMFAAASECASGFAGSR